MQHVEVKVKKLWRGNIDIRSYVIKEAFENNWAIRVTLEGDQRTMTLLPQDFETKLVAASSTINSKINGKNYKLLSYQWKPDVPIQMQIQHEEQPRKQVWDDDELSKEEMEAAQQSKQYELKNYYEPISKDKYLDPSFDEPF